MRDDKTRSYKRIQRRMPKRLERLYQRMFSTDILYHAFVQGEKDILYDEYRGSTFAEPVHLTGSVSRIPRAGDSVVNEQRFDAVFRITLQSLRDKGVPIEDRTKEVEIRKGYIEYQGVNFEIQTIDPITYVADLNMMYNFNCREKRS